MNPVHKHHQLPCSNRYDPKLNVNCSQFPCHHSHDLVSYSHHHPYSHPNTGNPHDHYPKSNPYDYHPKSHVYPNSNPYDHHSKPYDYHPKPHCDPSQHQPNPGCPHESSFCHDSTADVESRCRIRWTYGNCIAAMFQASSLKDVDKEITSLKEKTGFFHGKSQGFSPYCYKIFP